MEKLKSMSEPDLSDLEASYLLVVFLKIGYHLLDRLLRNLNGVLLNTW